MDQGFETVYVAQGELEESQVRAFLAAHGITTWVRGEALRKTHGLTLDGLGAVEILVAAADGTQAKELIAKVASGEFTLDDSVEP
jgi:predicted deacylase